MLFALGLAFIATVGGTLATYLYDEDAPLAARLCAGASFGLAAFGLVSFIVASVLGLTTWTLLFAAGLVCAPTMLVLGQPEIKNRIHQDLTELARFAHRAVQRPSLDTTGYFIFYGIAAIVFWLTFDRVMFEQPDGAVATGVLNNYGDLPFHLSVITRFVYGQNFPPEDPTFAGARFTYPFISDFIAACFVRAGASLRDAMFLENVLLALAFTGLLHRWALEFVRDRIAAILTPLLVLLSGGFGWLLLFDDVQKNEKGLFAVLLHPTHSYTIIPETTWRWGNAVTSLLLTQRSFLLGFPLAIIVFTQWWAALNDGQKSKKTEESKRQKAKGKSKGEASKKVEAGQAPSSLSPFSFLLLPSAKHMLAAGVAAGLLPLVHAHSFVVVMGMAGCLALLFWNWRLWAIFFVATMMVAGPQLWWSTSGSAVQTSSFFGWEIGWDRHGANPFWFWLKNTGFFIPLTVAAFLWREKEYLLSRRVVLFFLPFTLCLIIPNLVRLAPWIWDNIKVIFYWWIASAPLVAMMLAHLWRKRGWARVAAILLLVSQTLAGALDVWAVAARTAVYQEFDKDGIAFAEMIKRETRPRAMILHAPIHNHPVFLTGRRSLMGYPGHIWTHGLQFGEREQEIKRIYAGGPDAERLMAKYRVEYIVASPLEEYVMPVNNSFFLRFEKVGDIGGYQLYKVARR
jgi:hypothetical protein